VDQLLGGLFGSQDNDDEMRRRGRAQDFVSRYETGAPWEGFTQDEALHNYTQVAGRLSPQQYEEAASDAFGRMSREERRELRRAMRQRGGAGMGFDDDDRDDPREMARAAAMYRQQQPGGLAGLFGMGGGQQQSGGLGGMMDNPLAKVAMGGIAAMAMKKRMGGR
jgi:hypothetical protein